MTWRPRNETRVSSYDVIAVGKINRTALFHHSGDPHMATRQHRSCPPTTGLTSRSFEVPWCLGRWWRRMGGACKSSNVVTSLTELPWQHEDLTIDEMTETSCRPTTSIKEGVNRLIAFYSTKTNATPRHASVRSRLLLEKAILLHKHAVMYGGEYRQAMI